MNFDEHEVIEAWIMLAMGAIAGLVGTVVLGWPGVTALRYFGVTV